MPELNIVDRDGVATTVESDAGYTVMDILQRHNFDVAAICGGCCSCATCHVYVDERFSGRLPELEGDELVLVESSAHYREGQSRLSCQIPFSEELDGIRLELAPED